jgi:DNA-binding HxlR family transcriptional regulator
MRPARRTSYPEGDGDDDPVARALALIGHKWSILIVRDLVHGPRRFTQIQRSLRADPKVITARLRELEAAGILSRTTYAEVPPRVEYALTQVGTELEPVIAALRQWGSGATRPTVRAGSGHQRRSRAARRPGQAPRPR